VTPSLRLDEDERTLAHAATNFCATHLTGAPPFSASLWRSFCERGLLALGTPDGEGGLRAIVAVCEPLAAAAFPGPFVDAWLAVQLLDAQEREAVIAGELIAVTGAPPFFAFGTAACLFIEIEGEQAFRVVPQREGSLTHGLGDEPWLEVDCLRAAPFADAARALCVGDVVLATYLAHAALRLVTVTSEHAQTRQQFGKPIAAFQAVSHPLASSFVALSAASRLARAAACAFDESDLTSAQRYAAAALLSSRRAALDASYTCHQKLGAIGITREGPAHRITSRIRSLATRAARRIAIDRLLAGEDA
jgi:alkylation response protein AidB-like acyl-CoA dehydrogenase